MKQSLLKDALSNYVVYGLQLLISVVAIPVYLAAYGDDLYGVYLLSLGLAQSLQFLEFGSGKALLRYVATYMETNEEAVYAEALQTCFFITIVSSVLIGCIFVVFASFRNYIFTIPPQFSEISFLLFIGAGAYSVILLMSQLPQALLRGAGVFYRRNVFMLVQLFVRAVLVFMVYLYQVSIAWLLMGEFFILVLTLIFDAVVINQEVSELLRLDLLLKKSKKKIIGGEVWTYAKETFYLSVVSFFSQNIDNLLIGFFLQVEFVTVYTIITKPYQVIKTLLAKVYIILQPIYVRLFSRGKKKELGSFVNYTGDLLAWLLFPFFIIAIIFFPHLLEWWLNTDEYAPYVIYGQLLLAVSGCRVLTTMMYQAIYVTGGTSQLFKVEIIAVVINLFISLFLINTIGVGGVIIGTCVQLLILLPLLAPVAQSFFSLDAKDESIAKLKKTYFSLAFLFSMIILILYWWDFYFVGNKYIIDSFLLGVTIIGSGLAICIKWNELQITTSKIMRHFKK